MATTYDKIATTTLGSSASSITFSSIAASWTDLRLVMTAITSTNSITELQFNGDTGTNYSDTVLYGNGTSAYSAKDTSNNYIYTYASTSSSALTIPAFYTIDIFSYAGSTYKTALLTGSGDTNNSGRVANIVGLWRSTSAITSVTVLPNSGTYSTGTTATLYGIKAA